MQMIRFKQVKELITVDLLQTNRQSNNNGRGKTIDKDNLKWRIFLQNVLFLFIDGSFFGTMIFNVPLPEFPGLFTNSLGFMALFILLQVFQLIFNLFYDNANLSEYLSLPFSLGELFLSKIATILINTLSFFVIPIVLFSMLGWQAGHNLFLVVPIAIVLSVIILAALILVPFVFIHLLHQSSFYRRHKKVFTIIIYIVMFVTLFAVIYSNEPVEYTMTGIVDSEPNALFLGFHQIFILGSMLGGWLKVGSWALLVAALVGIVFKWIVSDLYSDEKSGDLPHARKIKTRKNRVSSDKTSSKWGVFVKYQLRQLQDTAFLIQMIFSKVYFPLIFMAPALFSEEGIDASLLAMVPNFWGIYLLVGALFAMLTVGEVSISGVIISFDKENYHYIQSLPLPFQQYMRFKFWFAFAIEWLIGALILGGIAFVVNLPLLVALGVLVGYTIGTFIATNFYYMRDYRLLNLGWNNFTELMQRGLNQIIRGLISFVLVLVGGIGTVGLGFWLIIQDSLWIQIGVQVLIATILIGGAIGIHQYAQKKFWVKFNA